MKTQLIKLLRNIRGHCIYFHMYILRAVVFVSWAVSTKVTCLLSLCVAGAQTVLEGEITEGTRFCFFIHTFLFDWLQRLTVFPRIETLFNIWGDKHKAAKTSQSKIKPIYSVYIPYSCKNVFLKSVSESYKLIKHSVIVWERYNEDILKCGELCCDCFRKFPGDSENVPHSAVQDCGVQQHWTLRLWGWESILRSHSNDYYNLL